MLLAGMFGSCWVCQEQAEEGSCAVVRGRGSWEAVPGQAKGKEFM